MSNPDAKPVFDTDDIEELGGEAELTFDTAGDFEYFCRHHPEMTGVVHVVPGGPDAGHGHDRRRSTDGVLPGRRHGRRRRHRARGSTTATSTTRSRRSRARRCRPTASTAAASSATRRRSSAAAASASAGTCSISIRARTGTTSIRTRCAGDSAARTSTSAASDRPSRSSSSPRSRRYCCSPRTRRRRRTRRIGRPARRCDRLKGDFVFHCHVHHHMMNGMIGLVRARQSLWLTDDMAHEISHRTGLAAGRRQQCVSRCRSASVSRSRRRALGRRCPARPRSPSCTRCCCRPRSACSTGATRATISRAYGTTRRLRGSYMPPANQPADDPVLDAGNSNMWSAEHTVLDTAAGTVLIHGGFSPNKSFAFDPATLTWTRVGRYGARSLLLDHADARRRTRRDTVRLGVEVDRALHARRRLGRADRDARRA